MDKFIVSARKYRPQTFDTVVGQKHITTTLKNAIKNQQLAHAFLFCGPRGVGKTTCARILAKTINCENVSAEGEACNTCHSCVTFNDGISMNIHELDAASNNSVDDIRTLVEQVRFAPQAGKYKVYIIDEVHMLSSSAFNAFLKTLEEPPPYAIFILATTEKHKILPTILSRCQIFDFKRILLNDTVDHLQEICGKEEVTAEKGALQLIAQKSEGCMRDALSIMDKIVSFTNGDVSYKNTLEHLNVLDEDYYFKLLELLRQQNLPEALLLYDEINKKGFEGDSVLNGLASFLRNLLVCKDSKAAILLEAIESFRDKYISTAKSTDASWIVSGLHILNQSEIEFKQARNKKLHVEMALIKLCYLAQALELSVGSGGTLVKKKRLDGPLAWKPQALQPIKPLPANNTRTAPVVAQEEAKLYVETLPAKTIVSESAPAIEKEPPAKVKLGKLDALRKQAAGSKNDAAAQPVRKLNAEELRQVWNATAMTASAEGKNASVVTVFELAELRLLDDNSFEVKVGSNINLKVIDQYRNLLMQNLQTHFNNRTIAFSVAVLENLNPVAEAPVPLNAKQQFVKLSAQYPLIKDLKDRLGLELDY
jgi:DNA polymerase III subunit gamma/tau